MAADLFQTDSKRLSRRTYKKILPFILVASFLISGCSSGDKPQAADTSSGSSTEIDDDTPPRDNTPQVLTPEASGTAVYGNDVVSMDLSNVSKGYMMLTYSGNNEKVKFQVEGPDGITCTYLVSARNESVVYPLTGGNGSYNFTLLESADAAKDLYAVAFTQAADTVLEDEFLPFLTPNVYVNYNTESRTVSEGSSLVKECRSDLDAVNEIYHFVIKNVEYDTEKAENVEYGYTPNVDDTLNTGKGICFDYAALMTAILRTQRIPTRLEVGYAGEAYHAWISCYLDEIGWVDDIIEFDGQNWSLMDPTLASNNSNSSVKKYIGDGSKYIVKYTY